MFLLFAIHQLSFLRQVTLLTLPIKPFYSRIGETNVFLVVNFLYSVTQKKESFDFFFGGNVNYIFSKKILIPKKTILCNKNISFVRPLFIVRAQSQKTQNSGYL